MTTNITLRYYNVFISKNGELTDIDFRDFLDYVIGVQNRQHGEMMLKRMKYPREMLRNSSDRAFTIADYRIRKPKQGEKDTDEYLDIENDIFEQTNCFYQHTEKLFLCEYNYYGAKIKQIKKYLENFLPTPNTPEAPKWEIEFLELTPSHSIETILNARDITNLNIKLNLTSSQMDIFNRNISQRRTYLQQLNGDADINNQVHSYLETTLNEMISTQHLFGGAIRNIIFSKGKYWRNNPFNLDALKALLCYIDVESDLFESIYISYKDTDGNVHPDVNLKHSKVLSKKIECEGDSWEIVTSAFENYFYNQSSRLGAGSSTRHHITCNLQRNEYPFN